MIAPSYIPGGTGDLPPSVTCTDLVAELGCTVNWLGENVIVLSSSFTYRWTLKLMLISRESWLRKTSVRVTGKLLAPSAPKFTEAGETVASVLTAVSASRSPAPMLTTNASRNCRSGVSSNIFGFAVFTTDDFRTPARSPSGREVNAGKSCRDKATAPATMGTAKLVPWATVYPVVEYISPIGSNRCVATNMFSPGATRSGLISLVPIAGPTEEK